MAGSNRCPLETWDEGRFVCSAVIKVRSPSGSLVDVGVVLKLNTDREVDAGKRRAFRSVRTDTGKVGLLEKGGRQRGRVVFSSAHSGEWEEGRETTDEMRDTQPSWDEAKWAVGEGEEMGF